MQALPAYKGASVATIRKMIGWETEENFANLLRVVDEAAFARTAARRRRKTAKRDHASAAGRRVAFGAN